MNRVKLTMRLKKRISMFLFASINKVSVCYSRGTCVSMMGVLKYNLTLEFMKKKDKA